jgi:hypothetical protein
MEVSLALSHADSEMHTLLHARGGHPPNTAVRTEGIRSSPLNVEVNPTLADKSLDVVGFFTHRGGQPEVGGEPKDYAINSPPAWKSALLSDQALNLFISSPPAWRST